MEGCRWEDQNLQLKGGSAPDEEEDVHVDISTSILVPDM
jgi:hypothetical protein